MLVNGVNSTNSTATSTTSSSNGLDKNAFLKILMAQLSNQDPLSSQDTSQYIAQMAQFSALEQSENMNTSIEKMLVSQQLTEGSMLIGKNVAFSADNNSYVQEVVKGVVVENSKVYLKTENGIYDLDSVIGVGDFENASQSGTATKD